MIDRKATVAVVVVWFHPTATQRANVHALVQQFGPVYVVDNTPEFGSAASAHTLVEGVSYFRNFNRGGIAQALNLGVDAALKAGAEYVVLFDQDSVVSDDFWQRMADQIAFTDADYLFPAYRDINSGERASAAIVSRWFFSKRAIKSESFDDYLIVLTSGSVIKASCLRELGPFRAEFFIDHVDTEFCVRMMKSGKKIRLCADVEMNHALGNRTTERLLGMTIKPYHYNTFRTYYRARNATILILENLIPRTGVSMLMLRAMIHEAIAIVAFEGTKRKKISTMLKGMVHGISHCLGKST